MVTQPKGNPVVSSCKDEQTANQQLNLTNLETSQPDLPKDYPPGFLKHGPLVLRTFHGYGTCPYCESGFRKLSPNQKTCGEMECIRALGRERTERYRSRAR